MTDLKRLRAETEGAKIITKHEWMIAALEILEKDIQYKREENSSVLYDALFIDPSKLTPYQ
jgi:hypothetical protein